MSDCATPEMHFEQVMRALKQHHSYWRAAFDGGRITSGGGLLWSAQADEELGLCEKIASQIPEWRGPSVRHSLVTPIRQ